MADHKKLTVFLSHSSRDKAFVRRLNNDLKSHSIETWLDEQNIPLGGSITDHVQKGLEKSDVLLVFLSEAAVVSRWVNTEWQTNFFKHLGNDNTIIIPVIVDDCQIPAFLADRRYLDFRKKEEYEENLSTLLEFLSSIDIPKFGKFDNLTPLSGSVSEITKDMLMDLDKEFISLPMHRRMPIVQTLKSLPRSGKKVRLEHFRPIVKVRSVYDHLLSLAHLADCLLPHINSGVGTEEYSDIALCIAYHEINEVILGDIPTYTSLTNNKRKAARIFSEERIRTISPLERKRISNDFIWMYLSDKHRRAFQAANKILSEPKNKKYIIFKALDKIDPVVSTWRYLHFYRGRLGTDPRAWNIAMKDFYENPDIKAYLRVNNVDHKLIDFLLKLQDRRLAWKYYEDPDRIFGDPTLFEIPSAVARQVIEGIGLFAD